MLFADSIRRECTRGDRAPRGRAGAHGGSGRAARYRGARGEVPRASARHRWRRTTVIVWTHLLRLRGRPLGSFLLEQRRLPDRSPPVLEAVWLGETETDGVLLSCGRAGTSI